ncbi:MAG: CPBP family intramembrane metalloprotease [Chloroflexota bacterium]|nr:CPBP family intramembrane metalloprotease [Chloroflexota bacterium]
MSEIIGVIMAFVPVILVLLLANLAERLRGNEQPYGAPALFAYVLLALMYGLGVMAGLGLHLAGTIAVQQPGLMSEAGGGFGGLGEFDSLPLLAAGIWAPSLLGLILLLPPVRRALGRILPIDTESPVHAVALSLSMLILVNLMMTLGVGLDTLTGVLAEGEGLGSNDGVTIAMLWVQQALMALTAALGVGWLTRRSWAAAARRLGVVRPSSQDWIVGIGAGLLLVPVVILLEYLASLAGIVADPDVEKLTEQLLGPLFRSPFGILTLGVAAALGEEPLFRGAAQPRFGLALTAVMFALVHSNYGITLSTAIVFLLGLVLGLLRIRRNTTTAMLAHAVYNISLGLLAYFSISFLDS